MPNELSRPTRISDGRSADTETIPGRRSSAQDPASMSERSRKSFEDGMPSFSMASSGAGFQIAGDRDSLKSHTQTEARSSVRAASTHSVEDPGGPGGLLTARFKHVVTEGGHAVITGRDGETLQRCEDEPIHIPGAVQSFGALVALHEESEGKLVVRVVSENAKRILGFTPRQLFAVESFTDILSDEQADNLLDHIDFVRDEGTDVEANGPEVFTMAIRDPQRKSHKLWVAVHCNKSNPDLIICEFELEDDPEQPLVPLDTETPQPPEDTLSSEPTEEELQEATESYSRPLRVLRSARKRRGEAAAMEVFNIMSQVQEQLAQAPNLDKFLKVLVGVVKELTGFHRVMIYQFDYAFNGKVVTELVDPRATSDLYKGLHFPASDIPKQARDLYKINKVRLLYDRDQETARLVCRTMEDLENPVDLTHSYLRAMSPIHIKYLTNMAVRSSMSISINAFNELWGLISCHAYGARGTRVSFPIRKMCRLVGDSASRNIERISYASRLQARKLINTSPTSKNPSGYIIASSDDLLSLFDADFGILSIHGETKILGKLEATQEALALLEYLRMRNFTSVVMSQDIRFDFQDLRYQPGFKTIAGLMLVPLSVGGQDFIVFFRRGQLKEVKWAGNPYEKYIKEGTEGYLEPRKSFKTWTETVIGKCREWTEEEIETAGVLCLVYGKFIEVWRQKEQAMQNTQLTKLLLQNSAHEVRTPLNAIINYLEIALEGALDSETRDNLAKSHSASKSLIYTINDLLDLTKTEDTGRLLNQEAFSPSMVFHDAVDMFAGDARRKSIKFEVIEDPTLPDQVLGDGRRIRQAISNVTANAIQATSEGMVKVEMIVAERREQSVDLEFVIEDTGRGMSTQKLDDLFAELEQAQAEPAAFMDEAMDPNANTLPGTDGSKKQALGLGLAVVARIVRNMEGQMRLKSVEGQGSRFVISLPFDLPASETQSQLGSGITNRSETSNESHGSSTTTEKPPGAKVEGELTLVSKASHNSLTTFKSPPSLSRQGSHGSIGTNNSVNSYSSAVSNKSDVDRLIEAIQEPQMIERSASTDSREIKRRLSRNGTSSRAAANRNSSRPNSLELPTKKVPPHLRRSPASHHGKVDVSDSGTPLRAIKLPIESLLEGSRVVQLPDSHGDEQVPSNSKQEAKSQPVTADKLRVLVAEDDPINSRIIEKRLQKSGHEITLTVNGEECSSRYGEQSGYFDIILMDMQVCRITILYTFLHLLTTSRCPLLTA